MPQRTRLHPYRGTPFKFPLRNEFPGRSGKLMRLAHDGRVVRILKGWKESDIENLATFVANLRQDAVGVPHYDVVRAPRWDRPEAQATYIVTESIVGERLDEISAPRHLDWSLKVPHAFYARFYEELDDFMTSLVGHYRRLLRSGGFIFKAMDQSQFLYGPTKSDKTPRVYFVDLDPTYQLLPPDADWHKLESLKSEFVKPIDMLFELQILHPQAGLERSQEAARHYFAVCASLFGDFYGSGAPWWAQSPNFAAYQRMKARMLGV